MRGFSRQARREGSWAELASRGESGPAWAARGDLGCGQPTRPRWCQGSSLRSWNCWRASANASRALCLFSSRRRGWASEASWSSRAPRQTSGAQHRPRDSVRSRRTPAPTPPTPLLRAAQRRPPCGASGGPKRSRCVPGASASAGVKRAHREPRDERESASARRGARASVAGAHPRIPVRQSGEAATSVPGAGADPRI